MLMALNFFLCIVLLLSNILFLNTIERGSLSIYVSILIILSLYLKDSPSKFKRELALIFIAVAAGIKIYPAIFGLVYLMEKGYKEALRLIIYGLLTFFLPFSFFGGINGFIQFLSCQKTLQLYSIGSSQASISTLLCHFTDNIVILEILSLTVLLILIFLSFLQREFWKKILLLTMAMIIAPLWSGSYTITYLIIPLLFFFKVESNSKKQFSSFYAIGFAAIFSCYLIPAGNLPINWAFIINHLGVYFCLLLVVIDTLLSYLPKRKKNS